jgi:K(+)-stimulated pyrophosphate-energized sodium pump
MIGSVPTLAEILLCVGATSVVWAYILPCLRAEHCVGPAETSGLIASGAKLYLAEQSRVLGVLFLGCWLPLCFLSAPVAFGFLIGAGCSWLVGQIAMRNATSANLCVVYAGQRSLSCAIREAVIAGCRAGIFVTWLPCIALPVVVLYGDPFGRAGYLAGLLLGISVVSLVARVGGGVFTKGADIGADLAGKLENGLPEDDMRNPAVLADNVGDNVGDCAGIATDLFESMVFTSAITCVLFDTYLNIPMSRVIQLLGVVFGAGALGSAVGIYSVLSRSQHIKDPKDMVRVTYKGLVLSTITTAILFFVALFTASAANPLFSLPWLAQLLPCVVYGMLLNLVVVMCARDAGDATCSSVKKIITASEHGAGANVIQGLSVGMRFVLLQALMIASVFLSFGDNTIVGMALKLVMVGLGMFSQSCFMLSMDGYGPIVDNAGGIAEVNGLDEVRKSTDLLDAAGNTLKGTTKSFLIIASVFPLLAGLCYLGVICASHNLLPVNVSELIRFGLVGLILGLGTIYGFSGMIMESVRNASAVVIADVRAQFIGNPNILLGTAEANHSQTIRLLVRESLRQAARPLFSVCCVLCTIGLLGYAVGTPAMLTIYIGFASGVLCGGVPLGLFMICSGGAWDNAKKAIEAAGHKNTPIHHAAVVGDTIGDPFKDTAGTSINPAIKFVWIIVGLVILANINTVALNHVLSVPYSI